MKGTNFLFIFCQFSPSERAEFNLYVQTFYAAQQKMLAALHAIHPCRPLNEEELFTKVYGEPLSHAKKKRLVQDLLSDLKGLALEYIAWKELRHNKGKGAAKLLMLEGLKQRNWLEIYLQQTEKSQSHLTQESVADLYEDLIAKDYYFYHATDTIWEKDMPTPDELIEKLNTCYVAMAWKYQCELLSLQKVSHKLPVPLPSSLLELTDSLKKAPFPVTLYTDMYNMMFKEDVTLYKDLKERCLKECKRSEEFMLLMMALINFQLREVNRGNPTALEEAFNLYKRALKHELFTLGGFFPNIPFNMIVTVACKLKEYEWVETFIEHHAPLLHPKEKKNTEILSKAKVFFEQKNMKRPSKPAMT